MRCDKCIVFEEIPELQTICINPTTNEYSDIVVELDRYGQIRIASYQGNCVIARESIPITNCPFCGHKLS